MLLLPGMVPPVHECNLVINPLMRELGQWQQINETVIQVVDPFVVDLLQKLWEYPASISGYCSSRCLIL